MPSIKITSASEPLITVYMTDQADDVTRNAAALFIDEIKSKTETEIYVTTDSQMPACALIISPVGPTDLIQLIENIDIQHDEGFAIRSTQTGIAVLGQTGAGVLYGVDHLLDSLTVDQSGAALPLTDIDDQPDSLIRGASFSTHTYGRYVEDREQLQKMKEQVRSYARNRLNCITIEATGKKWPGDLSPVVTWKYFPPLADDSRNGLVAKRIEHINELISYAHSWGIKVILYTSEFNHEPDIYQRCPELHGTLPETWAEGMHNYIRGCICLSKDIAWQYWHAKVKEALEALPELDALEVWTAEVPGEFGICVCDDCRKLTRSQWLEKFYNATRQTMDQVRPDMPLYIKTFQSSQGSLEVERFAPLKGKLPYNSVIHTKGQFGDMAYLNDPHPLLGWIQDGNEAAEFDVGGEYRGCGLGAMVCCIPEYLAERMRLYYSKGVRRFFARHAVPDWPNKDINGINDFAFYKLAWNINADVDSIWLDWATCSFGETAAEGIVDVLQMTDEVVNKSLYARNACVNRHYYIFPDNLDSLKYMMVDLSAQMIKGGLDRLEPTSENIAAIIKEKEHGIKACEEMIEKFNSIAPSLDPETRARLESIFARTQRIAIVMRYLIEAAFCYFQYERTFFVRARDNMRPQILQVLNLCEQEITESEKMQAGVAHENTFWGLWKIVDFDRARRLCDEIRGLVNFRIGQKADYTFTVTPATVGHPNTYALHRKQLREIFGLPGEG